MWSKAKYSSMHKYVFVQNQFSKIKIGIQILKTSMQTNIEYVMLIMLSFLLAIFIFFDDMNDSKLGFQIFYELYQGELMEPS